MNDRQPRATMHASRAMMSTHQRDPEFRRNVEPPSPRVTAMIEEHQRDPEFPRNVEPPSPFAIGLDRLPGGVRQRLGAVLLAIVVSVVIIATAWPGSDPDPGLTLINGYGGNLKVNFLEDPAVAEILAEEYGLRVNITGRGSIELACGMPFEEDDDFVWLGDPVALAKYQDLGCSMLRADNVYNSPVVLYSWAPVADALVAAGVAEETAGGAYTLDFAHLVELMMAGTTWTDIGLTQMHGRIIVHTTDPARSNSGLLFAGMLANTLNGGEVVTTTTVTPVLPDIQAHFNRLGLMQPTSGDLFEQFLITGMGAKPIVALYESQIQEFLASNPSYRDQITSQVRVIYPQPTVWATHPFVARTDNANLLLTALMDHDIQRLAWERHGQRPGDPSVVIDPEVIPVPGILAEISSVTSMPSLEAMDLVLAAIAGDLPHGTPASSVSPLAPLATLAVLGRARLATVGLLPRSPVRRWTMHPRHGLRTAVRRWLLLVVVLGSAAPGVTVAQGTGDVSVDVVVGWSAPFEERTGNRTVPDAVHETILANDDDTVIVANGNLAPAPARLGALEALGADGDAIVTVDAGTSGDPQYWLDLVSIDGAPYGAFTLARGAGSGLTLTMFVGPVATFADGMAQAQQVVLVDGSPIFNGVDPSGLQALLEAGLPALDAGGQEDDSAATDEADEGAEPTPDESGLVDEGTYVSPHHGFALTWTEEWMLDPAFEEPVTSDVNFDVDQVYLTVNSPQWVWCIFTAAGIQGFSFTEVFNSVSSPSSVRQSYGETAEVLVSRLGINADGDEAGAFLIRVTTPEGYDFLAYEEWRVSGDGSAIAGMQLLMLADDVGPGLEASNDLEIDGGPVITLFTEDEIVGAINNGSVL